jgi:hypothetical protein
VNVTQQTAAVPNQRCQIIEPTALREGNCAQPEYSSSLVCAMAIEWLL